MRFRTLAIQTNLFKTSGRGVLLIHNIMDEVEYNAQGNRVKMVKRPEDSVAAQPVESSLKDDNPEQSQ